MTVTEITAAKKKNNEPIRLAAYCRVSSNSGDQLHSFAAQIRYYKDYEKKNPQYKLVDIYADEGLTGTEMKKRDELHRLIRDSQKGKIDRVIVKSVSRFARNTQELLVALRTLKELGVSVYFEEQGIDTDLMNMEMLVTFPGMAAQKESENISENMRWSYQKRMQSGEFNCCTPAYGFNLVNGVMEINEKEAAVVRRIFSLYLSGIGIQNIANILIQEQIPRKDGKTEWSHSAIRYILTNERYIGDALLQKKYTTDTLPFRKRINRGEKPQYYVENSNPAIIEKASFEAAKALLNERKREYIKNGISHPLSKIIRCPECGKTFRRQIVAGIAYWMCSGHATGKTACQSRRVREDEIYEAFTSMLWKLKDYRQELLGVLINDFERMQSRTSDSQAVIGQIDKEIADLTAQNLVLTKLHNKGILSVTDYNAQAEDLNGKIKELRAKRKKIISEDENDELLSTLRDLNQIIAEYEKSPRFDDALFEQIIESAVMEDNAHITFALIGGIKLTEEIEHRGRKALHEKSQHTIRVSL